MVTVASVQPHAGPGGRIIDALLRGQRRLQDNPYQEGCFTPSVLFPPSSSCRRLFSSSHRRGLFLSVSYSLLGGLSPACILPKCISTVVDVSVETEDPTTPPANHAAATPAFLEKAKRKQITAQSSRELQAPLVPARGEIFQSGLFHTVHLKFQKSTLS